MSNQHLQLHVTHDGDLLHIEVIGELDPHTAPQLEGEVRAGLFNETTRLLELDVTGVTFIDSSGLRVIISALKLMRERDGRLVLVHPNDTVRNLLKITNLTDEIEIRDS